MTCGINTDCVLCDPPTSVPDPEGTWGDYQGRPIRLLPKQEPAYEGIGNLTYEMRTGRQSHKPHIRLCTGCLKRVLGTTDDKRKEQ